MKNPRHDGLTLMLIGCAVFVLFGVVLKNSATDSMADFRAVYVGTRCLIAGADPYDEKEWLQTNRAVFGEPAAKNGGHGKQLSIYVYLPPAFLFVAPFAILPWAWATWLWLLFAAAVLIAAALAMWEVGSRSAPVLTGFLIAFVLANGAIVLGNGNSAGVAVGLCVIAVWCILSERAVWAGVLCLAVSLALKPHDAGLVWLYFVIAPMHRRRALQTLGVSVLVTAGSVLWTGHTAPHWVPELRANLAEVAVHGGLNDPGPDGMTTRSRTMEEITDLQAVLSVWKDDARMYDWASYGLCGAFVLVWSAATVRARSSPLLAWLAIAAIAPVTLLATYHRAYDARLLLLTIPACAMLWAEGGSIGKLALAITGAGLWFSGEIPLAALNALTKSVNVGKGGVWGAMTTIVLTRPATLCLLAMAVFYLWIYVRGARTESPARAH